MRRNVLIALLLLAPLTVACLIIGTRLGWPMALAVLVLGSGLCVAIAPLLVEPSERPSPLVWAMLSLGLVGSGAVAFASANGITVPAEHRMSQIGSLMFIAGLALYVRAQRRRPRLW